MKGLEPDIQKLIAKHKAELKKLKSVHQVRVYCIMFLVIPSFENYKTSCSLGVIHM